MKTEEQLKLELESAETENWNLFQSMPPGLNFDEFDDFMEESNHKVARISREYRMVKTPEYHELSDFGDVMSLNDFIDNVKDGWFIDYDGFGRYVKDGMESDIEIYPSDIDRGSIRKDFDTIVWFNR